ncbi:MAG TPA: hypothetical protein PLV56_00510, partial [Synergistales bacterium]|nr:hypothetical protein [Synergistales bacterium]
MDQRSLFLLFVSLLVAYGTGKFHIARVENRLSRVRSSLGSLESELPFIDPFSIYMVFMGFIKGLLVITLTAGMSEGWSWTILKTAFIILGNRSVRNRHDGTLQNSFVVFGSIYALYPLETSPVLLVAVTLFLTFGEVYLPVLILLTPALLFLIPGEPGPGIVLNIYVLLLILWILIPCRDLLKYQYDRLRSAFQLRAVRRKLYRYCGFIFPCIIYPFGGHKALMISLAIGTLILWPAELVRKYHPPFRTMTMKIMGPIAKEEEREGITGTSKYILGCFMASLFPDPLNALSIIMLTLGDPWAVLIGRRAPMGKWFNGKSASGSLACLAACLSASYVFILMKP